MVTTVRPNATETPSSPMPTFGKAAASTALPQPPSTSQNVPMNSATMRMFRLMSLPLGSGTPSNTGQCWRVARSPTIRPWSYVAAGLLQADTGGAGDTRGVLDLGMHETGEFFRRHAHRLGAEGSQPLAHLRRRHRAREVARDFLHHRGRCPGGRP